MHLAVSIWLILYSTVAYYLPLMIYDLSAVNFGALPEEFYSFYCLFIAFNFSLVFMYALALFIAMPTRYLKAKILILWLVIAELSTFVEFVLRKYFFIVHHSDSQMWITLFVFIICCVFLFSRSIMGRKSDNFNKNNTYIIKYKPKNILGILNHIKNLKGHSGIYQDGQIYKFSKTKGIIKSREANQKSIEKMVCSNAVVIQKTNRIDNIDNFLGKKFRLFKYNCNHFIKDARN